MALRDNTIGEIVNAGLRCLGEPSITSFTAKNELQNVLIDQINETEHDLLEAARFRWGLNYDFLQTKAALTTGTVGVTNASTTVTSYDADGVAADNFTNVEAGDFLRVTADNDSYEVASVSTGASPDTLTLADAYTGSTSTSASYTILRDIYGVSISNLDEIVVATYGENSTLLGGDEIKVVSIEEINMRSAGNLHRNSSGRPRYMAEMIPNASNNPQYLFWPYPDSIYHLRLWFTRKYSSGSTFATVILGQDAPDIAYDAIRHKVRWRACIYDNDRPQAEDWQQEYQNARFQLVARESRQHRDENQMSLETYRSGNYWRRRSFGQSQILFDRT